MNGFDVVVIIRGVVGRGVVVGANVVGGGRYVQHISVSASQFCVKEKKRK